jgi:hypothetical protein
MKRDDWIACFLTCQDTTNVGKRLTEAPDMKTACLRGPVAAGAGSLRQARAGRTENFAETGCSHKRCSHKKARLGAVGRGVSSETSV